MPIVMLRNVRLAFPSLFEPSTYVASDGSVSKPRYGARFIMAPDHPAVKEITKAIHEAAGQAWKEHAPGFLKAFKGTDKLPIRNGDLKPQWDGFAGNLYLSANRGEKMGLPTVLAQDGVTPLRAQDGLPYAGCYVNASVDIYGQKKGGERINATLRAVQFLRHGDAFGGGAPVKPGEFDDVSEGATMGDFGAMAEEEESVL